MKLTIGKLISIIILSISIINRIIYHNTYHEIPFNGDPDAHGVWTTVTRITTLFTVLILIGIVLYYIIKYWNIPIEKKNSNY